MPTYEYACKSCGEHLEVVQSFKDEALTVCPNCKGELRKVFGSIGIAFKGSGFYKTDSRAKSSSSKSAESKAASGGESSSSSTAKTDKAETKSEPKKDAGSSPTKTDKSSSGAASAS